MLFILREVKNHHCHDLLPALRFSIHVKFCRKLTECLCKKPKSFMACKGREVENDESFDFTALTDNASAGYDLVRNITRRRVFLRRYVFLDVSIFFISCTNIFQYHNNTQNNRLNKEFINYCKTCLVNLIVKFES